jgi:hypothetical protein
MLIAGLRQATASMLTVKAVLHTFKAAIRKFMGAADTVFGPGFLNIAEHHFMKKNGHNRFAILLSEPKDLPMTTRL